MIGVGLMNNRCLMVGISCIGSLLILLMPHSNALNIRMSSIDHHPLVITSDAMLNHQNLGYHPENPQRLAVSLEVLRQMESNSKIRLTAPLAESCPEERSKALQIINSVHDPEYVAEVEQLCKQGARMLSPWDQDTYISSDSFESLLVAQSAWFDATDAVLSSSSKRMAFAVTRPPGHHAVRTRSMGFCIFNFAVGAVHYARQRYGIKKIAILDFDVHYGNGVADLVKADANIRYASLHQEGIFPPRRGLETETGDHGNLRCIPLPAGTTWKQYRPELLSRAIPFLQELQPEMVIICAGYDAMSRDETAEMCLRPEDYQEMAADLRDAFGDAILFGLEGGYNLEDLPLAIKSTILPFVDP